MGSLANGSLGDLIALQSDYGGLPVIAARPSFQKRDSVGRGSMVERKSSSGKSSERRGSVGTRVLHVPDRGGRGPSHSISPQGATKTKALMATAVGSLVGEIMDLIRDPRGLHHFLEFADGLQIEE